MFNNTLYVTSAASGGSNLSIALVDGPTNRKTLRSCVVSDKTYELSIGHQASNENPGFDTKRSVVRLGFSKMDAETGKEYTAYVQLILSIPQDVVDATAVEYLVAQLISFLVIGDASVMDSTTLLTDLGDGDLKGAIAPVVDRLYAGEP